jgi:hypothetical protein
MSAILPPPLPKWVGVLGYIAAIVGSANESGLLAFIPHPYGALLVAIGGFASVLAHSLTGSGGKPTWETPDNAA